MVNETVKTEINYLESLSDKLQTEIQEKRNEVELYEEDDTTYLEEELIELESKYEETNSALEVIYNGEGMDETLELVDI